MVACIVQRNPAATVLRGNFPLIDAVRNARTGNRPARGEHSNSGRRWIATHQWTLTRGGVANRSSRHGLYPKDRTPALA